MSRRERIAAIASFMLVVCAWAFVLILAGSTLFQAPTGPLPTQAVLPTLAPTTASIAAVPTTVSAPQIAQQPNQAPESTQTTAPLPSADQKVIVRFAPQATETERSAYVTATGGAVTRQIEALNAVVLTLPQGTDIQTLPASPVVIASEPDYLVTALMDVPPSDTYFAQQWGLEVVGAPPVWPTLPQDTPPVQVAVIDSGICADHPDLSGRIRAGYDFAENDTTPQDDLGHGCAVAGIIGANIDNGMGIAGIAPNAQIMPVRVLDSQGVGTYSDVAAGITYAVDHGAQIVNLSLGGPNPSSLLADAVAYAAAHHVLVVAAAGNTGQEGVLYPAAYDPVIAVGSVDPDLQRSSFSSYGPQIGLLAPGRDILATAPDDSYVTLSGTSMAAPHVTGVAALAMALGKTLTIDGGIVSLEQIVPPTPPPAASIPPQYRDLYDRAVQEGTLHLIVGLNAPYQPESQLSRPQALAQEANIMQVRQNLVQRLESYNVAVAGPSKMWPFPFVAMRADAHALQFLTGSPDVVSIVEDVKMYKDLARSVPFIGADDAYSLGYDGTGVAVAILDDGIDADHEFFGGRVVEEACYSNFYDDPADISLCPNGNDSQEGPGAADIAVCATYDSEGCDHGTHVAGIAAGSGGPVSAPSGVAKNADIIAIQVFTGSDDCYPDISGNQPCIFSYTGNQIDAIVRVLDLSLDYDIAAVNMSLGVPGIGLSQSVCDAVDGGFMTSAMNALQAEGIAPVVSAGNDGITNGLSYPACLSAAISVGSVGAYGSMGSITDSVSIFSDSSSTLDLLAPGGYIKSSVPNDVYGWKGGTSMAAPHVTGAFALLRQVDPYATVDDMLNALKSTGVPVTDTRNSVTTPRIDVYSAVLDLLPPALVVNSTADPGDGTCDSTECTLREVINLSNATSNVKESINFDIGGGGQQTIVLGTDPLPPITAPVIIDGTTQPGFAGTPLIEIDGVNVDTVNNVDELGLNITAGESIIRGLVINNFGYGGIGLTINDSNIVAGNYIGTEPDGTTAAPNLYGVIICSSDYNRIGGTLASERNIISGNDDDGINICQVPGFSVANGNLILGNYIGLDVTGSAVLGNGDDGIKIEDAINTRIGGTVNGARNIISGNFPGMFIFGRTNGGITIVGPVATGTVIQGNYIGTNAAGTSGFYAPGNDFSQPYGILIEDSSDNLIGGTTTSARNVISGNQRGIVLHGASTDNMIQGNFIGTDATGTAGLPNQNQFGVFLGDSEDTGPNNNLVGGTASGAGNVISGNQAFGIWVVGDENTIQGNFIGTDLSGTLDIGNAVASGVALFGSNNLVGGTASGAGNIIAYNTDYGVAVEEDLTTAVGNAILGNRIFGNKAISAGNLGLGIDLNPYGVTLNDPGDTDGSPNNLQNFPVLSDVQASLNKALISGTLNSTSGQTFHLEFFLNNACDPSGYGEGEIFLGALDGVTTDGSGDASFTAKMFGAYSAGQQITATATDPSDNTSEFSACLPISSVTDVLTVNTTSGANDGVCDSQCSLADAIIASNNLAGQQTIAFDIPGGAPYTIKPTAMIPSISNAIVDATTQPGYAGSPIVVLDGSLTSSGSGLTVNSDSLIRGFVINNFRSNGISLIGNNNVVEGNYIGTDVTGTTARPNLNHGVDAAGHDNLIGGTTAAARNVISGNNRNGVYIGGNATTSYSNTVQGNYIGTNASGTAALPNGLNGMDVLHSDNIIGGSEGTTPGGPCTGACNLISGNSGNGIRIVDQTANPGIEADNNIIQGNYIGTNVTGTAAIPNGESGIHLYIDTKFNLIGGSGTGEGNLISGNMQQGIEINGDDETRQNTIQGNLIGTDVAGTARIANGQNGIYIAAASTANQIGGDGAGEGNLISGNSLAGIAITNADDNIVQGNLIGTKAGGTTALGNTSYGISLSSGATGNQIGGVFGSGAGNLISGNGGYGIYINGENSDSNQVGGNLIGTDISGMAAIPNAGHGVLVNGGADSNVIGTSTNLISGNTGDGVSIASSGTNANAVQLNIIGAKIDLSAALANTQNGIEVVDGSSTSILNNTIAGNVASGIVLQSAPTTTIQGNHIGNGDVDDSSGQGVLPTMPLGNGQYGLWIKNSSLAQIGGTGADEFNVIAFNANDGIYIEGAIRNTISANVIDSNGGLGIDLAPNGVTANDTGDGDTGANDRQNFPVISEVTAALTGLTVDGTLNSHANTTYRLEFFNSDSCDASGYGEGRWFVGSMDVTTNGSGNATFSASFPDVVNTNTFITATATDPSGSTSEFAKCAQAILYVTTPEDFAVTVNSEIDIQLDWTDASIDETQWLVERSLAGQNHWTQIASIDTEDEAGTGATVTYHDTTFLCSKGYDYRLRAFNQPGGYYSHYAGPLNATPSCPTLTPPTDLALMPGRSQIELTWTDTNSTETGYQIEHSTDGGTTWKPLVTMPANTESYIHSGLICATGHSYRVQALRGHDHSITDFTAPETVTTDSCPAPVAPINPTASPLSRSTIQVSWESGAPGETTTFSLERSADGSNWQTWTTVPASTTTLMDSNLNCAQTYYYRVRSYRAEDNSFSDYSTPANATTSGCATAVTQTVGLYRQGVWQFWETNQTGQPIIIFSFGPTDSGWQPVVGDWDGDGIDGIGLYKNGIWQIRNATSSGPIDSIFQFGPAESGWQPVVGDWDGDGADGFGLYRNGLWLMRQTASGGSPQMTFNFGAAESGWQAVAGDWDGGGTATVGLYRNGLWLLSSTLPALANIPPFSFGQAGQVATTGDWDEDGSETVGVYKDGVWQLRNSNASGVFDMNFGTPGGSGWTPLAIYRGGLGGLTILAMAPGAPVQSPTPQPSPLPPTVESTEESTVEAAPTGVPESTEEPTAEPVIEATDEAMPTDTPTLTPTATSEPPTATATQLPPVTSEPPTVTPIPTSTPEPPTTVPPTDVPEATEDAGP